MQRILRFLTQYYYLILILQHRVKRGSHLRPPVQSYLQELEGGASLDHPDVVHLLQDGGDGLVVE